ncbi:hypothetical protein GGR56DRAFT_649311 [Xylariaceae sp. FL0804]|nr:hypothetical protein GGR56DRAFT_649311 [Xylariaceae sp. FL0804]
MAPPPRSSAPGYGYGYASTAPDYASAVVSSPFASSGLLDRDHGDFQSICDDILAGARTLLRRLWAYAQGRGRLSAWGLALRSGQQIRRNLAPQRLVSFPHLLVAAWVLVLLWGERWTFAASVRSCDWDHWEDWPSGATPHRLVFVADPQIIDPHSYPGRPWPINPLTMRITDNYMRRSYTQIQKALHPDTVIFLGDLFDGGREWKTAHGEFEDPDWAKSHRPKEEQRYLSQWNRDYGESYWLKEYARFSSIFFDSWNLGGEYSGAYQRGRKLIASLPGNHDLGFGAEVKVLARHRFNTYFGETNRVDVVGNHTVVSVDTVSLSADTSSMKDQVDLSGIYEPVQEFLADVKATKRRAVQKELRFWRGEVEELVFQQKVEDLESADYSEPPTLDPGENAPDFPTILLTHVPLHRNPGTPCGPLREHWPPMSPPKWQDGPVIPDHRNAITVAGGYQYQNVLSEEDSIKLVKSIGNVKHVFSGDDHDYCEVVHSEPQENVREITVKSLSMAMGVPTPGFEMVSLWNPIDAQGNPLSSSTGPTLQTHLCLLPRQATTYMTYAVLAVLSLFLLAARAVMVPVLNLQPFALGPVPSSSPAFLPIFKAKAEAEDGGEGDVYHHNPHSTSTPPPSSSTTAATSASSSKLLPSARMSRARGPSLSNGLVGQARNAPASQRGSNAAGGGAAGSSQDRWGWGRSSRGPRIEIRRDGYYDARAARGGGAWRPAAGGARSKKTTIGLVTREIWTSCWRVAWMVLLFFAYLTYKG